MWNGSDIVLPESSASVRKDWRLQPGRIVCTGAGAGAGVLPRFGVAEWWLFRNHASEAGGKSCGRSDPKGRVSAGGVSAYISI